MLDKLSKEYDVGGLTIFHKDGSVSKQYRTAKDPRILLTGFEIVALIEKAQQRQCALQVAIDNMVKLINPEESSNV